MQGKLIALAAFLAGASAAPVVPSLAGRQSGVSYVQYRGDGSTQAGWPAQSDWVSDFESLWALQQGIVSNSCGGFGQANNSPQETSELHDAIRDVGQAAGVDPRFVLAVVLQESGGCVRVWNTSAAVNNPGLMQDHDGVHSCNTGTATLQGTVQDPCPASEITGMIQDGTLGREATATGDGLKQTLAQGTADAGSAVARSYYIAARIYNSGSYNGGDLGAPGATPCYSSDIANRLRGWIGQGSCSL